MYKPEFAKCITPVASPALTHCGLLKDILGDDIKVVFIGPCIAKKNEADEHPDLMSAALTFDELNYWIKEEFIDIENIEVDENDILKEVSEYLRNNEVNIYTELKDMLCSEDEYQSLISM
jgi:iron only hydrogenase large subunit-like protein